MDYPTTHRSISFTVLFICLTTVLVLLGVRAIEVRVDTANAADGNGTALRLQVIPHSDHPRDQDLKLMVHDEVLALLKEDIQSPQPSAAAVVDAVRERIPLIEERVAALLETAGRSLPVRFNLNLSAIRAPLASVMVERGEPRTKRSSSESFWERGAETTFGVSSFQTCVLSRTALKNIFPWHRAETLWKPLRGLT